MAALAGIGGEERYWVHIPARKPRAYKNGGLVAAARAVKGSPLANEFGDSELIHVNKYELEQLREMWGEPGINPETGLPAYGLFKVLKKIVKGVAKIGATVALTPVLGPVGAAAAVNAVDTAISGGNLGDIVKSAAVGAATAGGAQLGGKYIPGLTGVSEEAGRAIGAGIAGAGVTAAQGGNLEQSLMGGISTGVGTFVGNRAIGKAVDSNFLGAGDAYNYLTNVGKDISNLTGIGGPPGGYTSRMDIKPAEGAADLRTYGKNVTNIPGSDLPTGDIVVTARPGTNLVFGSGGYKFDTSGKGLGNLDEIVQREDYTGTPEEIVVTGDTSGTNLTLGQIGSVDTGSKIDLINSDITQDEDGTIYVNGTPASEINFGPATIDLNNDGKIDKKDDEIIVNAKEDAKVVIDDKIFDPDAEGGEGTRTQVYPDATVPQTEPFVPLTPTGGTYAQRTMNRGLASIGFDPFSYGQADGSQPGEFMFFTENGAPFGDVGAYTGPRSGIADNSTAVGGGKGPGGATGGTTTGGATTGGTPPGGTPGGSTQTRPAGFTGVMSGQKIGDKQIVDGKTYVWGGDGVGWQFLATDNNGNQVLMPGNGATNVTSIADAFKSGVYRNMTAEEQAANDAIFQRIEDAKNAPTAAAAKAILPGIYFDIDEATAAAIGRPDLIGTQMTKRDLNLAKQAADEAAKASIAAQIPTQIAAAQAAPAPGMTARSYYMDYVTPLASSYYSTGKLDAAKARALQQAVEPFVGANDLTGAQSAVNAYLSSAGLTPPAMADGGVVDSEYQYTPQWKKAYLDYMQGRTNELPPRLVGNTEEEWARRMSAVREYGPDVAEQTITYWDDVRADPAYAEDIRRERETGQGRAGIGNAPFVPAGYAAINGAVNPIGSRGYGETLSAVANTPNPMIVYNVGGGEQRTASLADLNAAASRAGFNPFTYGQSVDTSEASYLADSGMAEGGEVEGDDMMSHLISYRKNGGHQGPGRVKGIGSGQEDKIPAWLSDGEYVWSAQDVADLGDGSTDEGVRRLDKMREMVRKQAGRKDVKKIAKPQRGIDKMLKAVGGAV